ncbi:hypothetical protein DL95DRAFT_181024 [Leptodontidium sp. 2 PMI_412]|nr:hypothetical protein DL95DRAFT_181024 [Leptodontidium sp. 2 PMI_412]
MNTSQQGRSNRKEQKKKKNLALRQHGHCVARMDWREAIFSTPLAYWAFFYYSFALEFLSPID